MRLDPVTLHHRGEAPGVEKSGDASSKCLQMRVGRAGGTRKKTHLALLHPQQQHDRRQHLNRTRAHTEMGFYRSALTARRKRTWKIRVKLLFRKRRLVVEKMFCGCRYPCFTPEDYVPLFKATNTQLVIRLNKKQYERTRFTNHGLNECFSTTFWWTFVSDSSYIQICSSNFIT